MATRDEEGQILDGVGVMSHQGPDFVKGVEAEEHGGGAEDLPHEFWDGIAGFVCVWAGVGVKHDWTTVKLAEEAVSREQRIAPMEHDVEGNKANQPFLVGRGDPNVKAKMNLT